MKRILLSIGLLLCLAVVVAATFNRSEIASSARAYQPISDVVTLDFRVHKFNPNGIELALNNQGLPTFFIQFDVAMQGISPVVTMTGVSNNSRLKGTAAPRNLPDFPFLRDKNGEPVLHFSFENQLGNDNLLEGGAVLRMRYRGTPVPLIETLQIQDAFRLPRALANQFGVDALEFLPGTLKMDGDAFYIPIRLLGDGRE